MVQIKQKSVYGVETPFPRSFLGGMYVDGFTFEFLMCFININMRMHVHVVFGRYIRM